MGCGSKPFASQLSVQTLSLANLTVGTFGFGYLGSRFSVIIVSCVVISFLSLSDFGRRLCSVILFLSCIVISFFNLSDFSRRQCWKVVFLVGAIPPFPFARSLFKFVPFSMRWGYPFPFVPFAFLDLLFLFPFSLSDPCYGLGGVEEGGGFVVVGGSAQMGVGRVPWERFGQVFWGVLLPVFPLPAKTLSPFFLIFVSVIPSRHTPANKGGVATWQDIHVCTLTVGTRSARQLFYHRCQLLLFGVVWLLLCSPVLTKGG